MLLPSRLFQTGAALTRRRGPCQSKMLAFLLIVAFHEIILGAEEHAYQQFIECAFDSQGQVDHTWSYGYDGKDIMHVDFVKKAVVATSEPGKMLEEERKHMEYIKKKEERLKMVCSAVKTVFLKSNNSLSRAAKPAVLLSAGGEQDQKYLKCVVRGFYPNVIRVRWTQKGRPIYFGVSSTGILPHRDGTFQMTSYLSLINMSAHDLICETEHLSLDGILRKTYEEKSQITEHVLWPMAAFFLGFLLPVFPTLLFPTLRIRKRRHTTKPPEDTSDRSEASLSSNLKNMSQET